MDRNKTSARYALLDEIRGLDLISMIFYHTLWDLVFIRAWLLTGRFDWYIGWQGHLWQQSICWVFILLSGFCVPLGRHTVRRGALVFAASWFVTLVTVIAMPSSAVWFGVLALIGSGMMLTALLKKPLSHVPPLIGLAVCFALFLLFKNVSFGHIGPEAWGLALPKALYANYFTAYLGFPPEGFYSSDYFALVPWLFLFWTGYFLHFALGRARMEPLRRSVCPPLGWLGRHSLIIYLLHQPVIYGIIAAVAAIKELF